MHHNDIGDTIVHLEVTGTVMKKLVLKKFSTIDRTFLSYMSQKAWNYVGSLLLKLTIDIKKTFVFCV